MVVDDRDDNLDAILATLSLGNYHVLGYRSAAELQSALLHGAADLVIIDIHLGCTDGRELCFWVKLQPRLSAVPVLLLSARPGFLIADLRKFGADAFLEKPFDITVLLDTVAVLAGKTISSA